ncbi:DUF2515 family protein [Burkholderia ambifaria]|jgi:hypothetical protein|uniref:DUF2515 family protein n=1 Tax=Burkholderia ambifaria TaxID=152480 RepID=UPI001FC84573|nr:hypothetical protein [Burkholderia ambifaria]
MSKCDDRRCPICYPNWREEEAAAKQRAEDDRQDCVNGWRHFQRQAEAIVSDGDPISINRRINAAYAQLWLDDRRFQWAGLAAFASKQVGCGLLNAADDRPIESSARCVPALGTGQFPAGTLVALWVATNAGARSSLRRRFTQGV